MPIFENSGSNIGFFPPFFPQQSLLHPSGTRSSRTKPLPPYPACPFKFHSSFFNVIEDRPLLMVESTKEEETSTPIPPPPALLLLLSVYSQPFIPFFRLSRNVELPPCPTDLNICYISGPPGPAFFASTPPSLLSPPLWLRDFP